MLSIFLLIPLSLMLFVVAIWAVRYAVKSNQFEDLDNASQRIILDDRQERRQTIQAHDYSTPISQNDDTTVTDIVADDKVIHPDIESIDHADLDKHPKI
ncbi:MULTISPECIES: cbb3-type cytochrome oxidase assembly protein CcoS [unclassified Psychrobacter]|uniref:cbb3-type cytochrome oxidase assembly protein CcoS n=1 Tax=unclassified Psychrobacter TaxID=196806 RepID=UPI000EE1998E|nr:MULTISPECIES: cbb3-type cytochrome oxidase assembly protein CcoS [unclassified Psychrobacter]MBE8608873.1 cbb3-type cytochrome oxidase assembly protein CcoS [Pseudomonas lundensis]HCI76990.1 cbb3-type cytochrome oxidase assembly protein CcoS [Psychrobacter sp.]